MRRRWPLALLALLLATAAWLHWRPSIRRTDLLLPLYSYPGRTWLAAESIPKGRGLIIVNPASGPGSIQDPIYALSVQALQRRNPVLGYVATDYGRIPAAKVLEAFAHYRQWYHVDGIFLDQVTTACSPDALSYYRRLIATLRARDPHIVIALNPGLTPGSCYAKLADVLVVFEGTYDSFRTWQPAAWMTQNNPSRFAAIVRAVPAAAVAQTAAKALREHLAYVYVASERHDVYAHVPSDLVELMHLVGASTAP